ncbi:ABC alpha-glucoside transporter, inner membrane subunit AglF [[Actinomadura] parvosata subsp. kistnae]|uniref:ABC transporter permease subunit n=1 Tax=Nonomuraea composti TaxID=2720023 RepID=A0ABX1BAA0_9ACTN|nr:ABC transporter permease subunit [Nonomuraea sp. ATCC 55076]NJP92073.1 ABC transporter permease subunit [Nonomuraea sp. FMUSA5-5]SPL97779.1 ABC alpha-glucoside transporter, inner membrane subunit AglF [Actinomadura parvosata subsp. kistnae]
MTERLNGRQDPPAASSAGGTSTGPAETPRTRKRLGPSPAVAIAFLLPAALLLGIWVVYPIVYSFVRSLFGAQNFSEFVGLGNYISIFTDPGTLTTIRNNLIWVIVAPIIVTTLGLIFAVLTERIKWATAFKLIVFMPMAVSLMAAGVIFRLVYEQSPDKGLANAVLTTVADTFSSSQGYPAARPREGDQSPVAAQDGGVVTKQPVQAGQPVLIPIVGVKPEVMPSNAQTAKTPAGEGLSGVVWFDFTQGGGGRNGAVDGAEKGLPGMTVEAVQNGQVAATATTAEDGSFRFEGLAPGSYTVRLPKSNFEASYGGLQWLGPTLITPAIIGAFVWVWAGFAMVLLAAGLAAIPRDALEAARIDGATEWQVFRRITVPLLSPVLLVVFVTMIINTLKVFDLVFIIAPASVQPQANVVALEMWRVSFGGGNNQGLGSALAIFLLVLVLPFMIMNIRRFRRGES